VQKILTAGVIGAAFVATLTFGGGDSSQHEPAAAQASDIAATAPAVTIVNAPVYWRGPRIIHVPQADDRDYRDSQRAGIRRAPVASIGDEDDDEPAPPPRRRVAPAARQQEPRVQEDAWRPRGPRWQLRSDAPPPAPQGPRRAILSAPPPVAEGPTPIRPTPRFGAKSDAADKFAAPREND
jgi:hypothetical protein